MIQFQFKNLQTEFSSVFGFRFSVFGFSVFWFSGFFSAAFQLSADKGKRWRDAVASIWVGLVDTPTLQVSFLYFVFHNTIPLWWMRWMRWDEMKRMWWRLDVDTDVATLLQNYYMSHWICRFLNLSDRQFFWWKHVAKLKTRTMVPLLARSAHRYPQGRF